MVDCIGPAVITPAAARVGDPALNGGVPSVSNDGSSDLQSLAAIVASADMDAVRRCQAVWDVQRRTGMSSREVANAAGVSESTISRLLTIGLLSEADKQRVRDGTLGLAAAYRLARGQVGARAGPVRRRRKGCRPFHVAVCGGVTLVVKRSVSALDAVADALVDLASRLRAAHTRGERSPECLVATP